MTAGIEYIHDVQNEMQALRLRRMADFATGFRMYSSIPIGAAIGATEPNWPVTMVDVIGWGSDAVDGMFGGESQRLNPLAERTEMSKRDPLADRMKHFSGLLGITARAVREQDYATAGIVSVNAVVAGVREVKMHRARKLAESYGFETDAIKINKWKTRLNAAASIALASPLSRNKTVRRASLGVLCAGTITGVLGLAQYKEQLHEHIGD